MKEFVTNACTLRGAAVAVSLVSTLTVSSALAVSAAAAECASAASACMPARQVDWGTLLPPLPPLSSYAPPPAGVSYITPDPAPLPFALTPSESGVAVRTGLGTLRDYNAKLTARKVREAEKLAPAPLKVPAPAAPQVPVEIWSSFAADGLASDTGTSLRTGAGADYKLSPGIAVGVSAERTERERTDAAAQVEGRKLEGYVALRPAPAFSLDAKTSWQSQSGSGGAGLADTPQASAEKSTITIAPSLRKPFALEGGQKLEPWITWRNEIDFGDGGDAAEGGGVSQSVGAGVSLVRPDDYALSVSADVDGLEAAEPPSVKSRLELKLPLQ